MKDVRYAELGRTGIKVSRICLGGMSFGEPSAEFHQWTLGYDDTKEMISRAIDAGINFIDTANVYSKGTSEMFIGRALKKAEHKTPVKDRPSGASYEHHGKRVTAVMTPDGKTVKTVYPLDPRDARKYHIDYEPLSNQNKADPKVKARMNKAQPKVKETKPKYKSIPTKSIRANYKRR